MLIPFSYSIRSLFVRKTTTVATALGIGLVVFVLAAALMLSRGIRETLVSSGQSDRAIVLRQGADNELSSGFDTTTVGIILAAPGVKKDGSTPLGSGEVVVVITAPKLGAENQISNVQVRGVTPTSLALRKELKVVQGRPPTPGTDEAMIGTGLDGRFAGMKLGDKLELKKNRSVSVVGVFEAGRSAFESEVWVDVDTLRSTFGREGSVCSVIVQLESPAKFDAFKATVEHDKQLGMAVTREDKYYEKQSEGTSIFITALGVIIALFFSAGAMIGATITMYAAVSQRSREIGTLQALGFSRTAVLLSFMLESIVLAFGGACLGALASLAMSGVSFSMMNFATWQEVSVAVGAFMGLVGGFFPAVRAARTAPIQAMRA
jgi:putative ABC transport system permease protein